MDSKFTYKCCDSFAETRMLAMLVLTGLVNRHVTIEGSVQQVGKVDSWCQMRKQIKD